MRRSNPFLLVFLACGLAVPPASSGPRVGVVGEAGVSASAGTGSSAAGASLSGMNTGSSLTNLPPSVLPGVPGGSMGQQFSPGITSTPNLSAGQTASVNPSATSGAGVGVGQDAGNAPASVSQTRTGTLGGNAVAPSGTSATPAARPGARTESSLRGEGAVRGPSGGPEGTQASGEPAKTGVATVDSVGGEFRKAGIQAAGGDADAVANTSEKLFTGGVGRGAVGAAGEQAGAGLAGNLGMNAVEMIESNLKDAKNAADNSSLVTQAQAPAFLLKAKEIAVAEKRIEDAARITAQARAYATPAKLSEFGNAALTAAASGKTADQKHFTAAVQNYNKVMTENPNEPHFTDIGLFLNTVEKTADARLASKGKGVKAAAVQFLPTAGSGASRVRTMVDLPADFAATVKPLAADLAASLALPDAVPSNEPVLPPVVGQTEAMQADVDPQGGFSEHFANRKKEMAAVWAFFAALFDVSQSGVRSLWDEIVVFFSKLFGGSTAGLSIAATPEAKAELSKAPAVTAEIPRRLALPVNALGYRLQPLAP